MLALLLVLPAVYRFALGLEVSETAMVILSMVLGYYFGARKDS